MTGQGRAMMGSDHSPDDATPPPVELAQPVRTGLLASLWHREQRRARIDQWIEKSDRPLLGLAILSMLLYLMDLRGLPLWAALLISHFNLLTDLVFVLDLVLKLVAQGRIYGDSPWFLIDF